MLEGYFGEEESCERTEEPLTPAIASQAVMPPASTLWRPRLSQIPKYLECELLGFPIKSDAKRQTAVLRAVGSNEIKRQVGST